MSSERLSEAEKKFVKNPGYTALGRKVEVRRELAEQILEAGLSGLGIISNKEGISFSMMSDKLVLYVGEYKGNHSPEVEEGTVLTRRNGKKLRKGDQVGKLSGTEAA